MGDQEWICEKCKRSGKVSYTKDEADVMSVVHKIGDDHKRVSPNCTQSTTMLRCSD